MSEERSLKVKASLQPSQAAASEWTEESIRGETGLVLLVGRQ